MLIVIHYIFIYICDYRKINGIIYPQYNVAIRFKSLDVSIATLFTSGFIGLLKPAQWIDEDSLSRHP